MPGPLVCPTLLPGPNWLKCWNGDAGYKSKLCDFRFQREYLFGPVGEILDKASDKRVSFPNVWVILYMGKEEGKKK